MAHGIGLASQATAIERIRFVLMFDGAMLWWRVHPINIRDTINRYNPPPFHIARLSNLPC